MNRFRSFPPSLLAAALVLGCSDSNSPVRVLPSLPQLASAVPVPITGTCDVQFSVDATVPTRLVMTGTGTCQMSHLGRTMVQVAQTADLDQQRLTGAVTFTAGNTDQLLGQVSAPIGGGQVTQLQGTVTFTGGTGRFASATGDATFTSTGSSPQRAAIIYNGSIQYGKSAGDPGPTPFTLDATRAVSQTVGIDGGTLTTRSSSGIDYELVVPHGALNGPVGITMTPIASMPFPGSGGFAAGVNFAPAGLRFAQNAILRITLPNRPAGLQLIVAGYDADPATLRPVLPADNGTVIEVSIAHFSGVAAGFGTTAELLAMPNPGPTTQSTYYEAQMASVAAGPLTPAEQLAAYTQLLITWLTTVIQPLFSNAATDAQLLLALSEFDLWNGYVERLDLTAALATEISDTKDMAAIKILSAVDGNADLCGAQQSLAALYNVGFWYLQALYIGVAIPQHFLDLVAVSQSISSRCLTLELESVGLVSPMVVGTSYTLSLQWGVRFKGQTSLQGVPLQVGTSPLGGTVTIAPPNGASDIAGLFETVITANQSGTTDWVVAACMLLPGLSTPAPNPTCTSFLVAESEVISWPAIDAIQMSVTPTSATLAQGATAQFTALVTGTSNQNVTWTATGGTITAGGLYTAGNVQGTYTVRATSVADPSISAEAQITIGAPFIGTLVFESQGNPGFTFPQDCGIKVPVAVSMSGTMNIGSVNLSGTFAGQFFCLSGAPTAHGTVSVSFTSGGTPTMTLRYLGVSTLIDNQELVNCLFTGPVQYFPALPLDTQYSVASNVAGFSLSAWLEPACSGVGYRRFTLTMSTPP